MLIITVRTILFKLTFYRIYIYIFVRNWDKFEQRKLLSPRVGGTHVLNMMLLAQMHTVHRDWSETTVKCEPRSTWYRVRQRPLHRHVLHNIEHKSVYLVNLRYLSIFQNNTYWYTVLAPNQINLDKRERGIKKKKERHK